MPPIRDRVRPMPASALTAMQLDAAKAIEDLRVTYLDVSRRQIDRVLEMVEATPPHDEAWRAEVYRIAHDLKGQGTTFGHDLVTKIATGLCALIRKGGACDDAAFAKRANAHAQAIRVVLDKDIRGPGGETGAALLKILSIDA